MFFGYVFSYRDYINTDAGVSKLLQLCGYGIECRIYLYKVMSLCYNSKVYLNFYNFIKQPKQALSKRHNKQGN
jgi:hypothetical protein